MRLIAVDINEVHDFTFPDDEGDPKVIFKIGTLDSYELAYLIDVARKSKGEVTNKYLELLEVVRLGLRGWENLKDRAGNLVPFKMEKIIIQGIGERELISANCMKMINSSWIIPIASEIIRVNYMTEDDKKN